ncbi:MAG: hypothetical protein ACLR7D_14100 [Lachnospira eligens]
MRRIYIVRDGIRYAAAATGSLAVYRAVNNISAAGGAADCIMNTIIIDENQGKYVLRR